MKTRIHLFIYVLICLLLIANVTVNAQEKENKKKKKNKYELSKQEYPKTVEKLELSENKYPDDKQPLELSDPSDNDQIEKSIWQKDYYYMEFHKGNANTHEAAGNIFAIGIFKKDGADYVVFMDKDMKVQYNAVLFSVKNGEANSSLISGDYENSAIPLLDIFKLKGSDNQVMFSVFNERYQSITNFPRKFTILELQIKGYNY
ncbi:MAG: hypothetical protein NTY12_05395 [Candidatus Falkowbacteria bacterium]|nr:hypothetical protein [Candidatus Falkowbacteria bacterium]